jgi:hypothetical protein
MKSKKMSFVALLAMVMIAVTGAYAGNDLQTTTSTFSGTYLTQVAELEKQIHVTFHTAVSVHDPVNGDSQDVINQRIILGISMFAPDGELTLVSTTSPLAGNYIGTGDPNDPTTCPVPSGDTSATGQQGTLCSFFKYVNGGLQITNKWVSLTPAFKTKLVPVNIGGQWQASFYFECHYFDVSIDPTTGLPAWAAKTHAALQGKAVKTNGKWLVTKAKAFSVSVPHP